MVDNELESLLESIPERFCAPMDEEELPSILDYLDRAETVEEIRALWFDMTSWPPEFVDLFGELYFESWSKIEALALLFALEQGLSPSQMFDLTRNEAERMELTPNSRKILAMQPAHPEFPVLFWESIGDPCVVGLMYFEERVAKLVEYPRLVEAFRVRSPRAS